MDYRSPRRHHPFQVASFDPPWGQPNQSASPRGGGGGTVSKSVRTPPPMRRRQSHDRREPGGDERGEDEDAPEGDDQQEEEEMKGTEGEEEKGTPPADRGIENEGVVGGPAKETRSEEATSAAFFQGVIRSSPPPLRPNNKEANIGSSSCAVPVQQREIVVELSEPENATKARESPNAPSAATFAALSPRLLSRKAAAARLPAARRDDDGDDPDDDRIRRARGVSSVTKPAPRHAYAHLAVQQVRQIEQQRRRGGGAGTTTMMPNRIQPRTAEHFYQWLTAGSSSAHKATTTTTTAAVRRKKKIATEYRLGLDGHHGQEEPIVAARRRRQGGDITLVPVFDGDSGGGRCGPSSSGSKSAAGSEGTMGETSDDDDEGDEDTAVAVATMMMMGPKPTMRPDAAHSGPEPSTTAAIGEPYPQPAGVGGGGSASTAAAAEAWRQASVIVAECHERMVSVQENAKLKQQQLRLHNEHLLCLLESSKVTIEQLQMRLIFSKDLPTSPSSPTPSTRQQPQQQPPSPSRRSGADSPIGDEHGKSRPSLGEVRGRVESVLAHQHVLLKENAALKQSLLRCGCDRCLEQYRIRQRELSGEALHRDVPHTEIAHATDPERPERNGPGVSEAAISMSLVNDIPIPSMVPTEESSSTTSSPSVSPMPDVPLEPLSGEVDATSVVRASASAEGDVTDPIPLCAVTSDQLDQANAHAPDSVRDVIGDNESKERESDLAHAEHRLAEISERVAERRKKDTPGKRRAGSVSSGPSLGEYLTTQQEDVGAGGSLAEHEYDRRYSRSFAESISLLSSMSRITFKTIDEDITVDCSMVDDETSRINDSTARLEGSTDVSMTPNELRHVDHEHSLRTFAECNGSTPPSRHPLVGSASSITTSLSNGEHADSFRVSTHSGEATVRNANRGADPGRSAVVAPVELRLGRPRRGRKAAVAPTLQNHDVSLDQVFLSSDPSKFISSPAIAPFSKSQLKETTDSTSIPAANRPVEVPTDALPKGGEDWQQKYVSSDDLYSSAVMSAMEMRRKRSSMPRHGRDSNPERFVAELSKCLQGGSTHSAVSESALPSDPPLAHKALTVPSSAVRSPHPLSYDDALVAAMSKESAHTASSVPATGTAASSASQRKGQWKAPTVFKGWK